MPNTPAAHIEYPRPEFVGRDDELLSFTEAARRAGITSGALANWRRRHDDFPEVAKLVHFGPKRAQKFIPVDEFAAFVARQREGRPRRYTGRRRDSAEVASEQLRYYTARLETLEAREAALLALHTETGRASDAAKLANTREALATARAREVEAVDRLTALIF
ncbi:hypothetical protein Q8791_23655 [Nocardiopsis sp. CT-R113]|uniref:Helix-turn-helix domain-containing protein n=1 Tax=Nocardiopsis codii TaxID=3065942 RepID=A0ABU7KDB0_9ACTN|nr:hypothetical protein [Nocardiopsis sp. CT-R113]MEE2040216.1 hypothetical protein [Nocardiopsis sp. CT-R113]